MPEFSKGEVKVLLAAVQRFTEAFEAEVVDVLARHFRGAQPADVVEVREQLVLLSRAFTLKPKGSLLVHDAQNGLLKRIILDERRRAAEAIDTPLQRTTHGEVMRHLQREVRPFDELMQASWFRAVAPARVPRLADYLSVRWAEAASVAAPKLLPREFDEKFHILEAPALFLPDLAHYRAACALRGVSLAVAYVDIDDFKAINTRYTETIVDQRVLTPFLELLEAHVFGRGHAYRFGGDEYVLLFPNADEAMAITLCRDLQRKVAASRFAGVDVTLGVSIGLCPVEPTCILTDREILARANLAKNHTKNERKGAIASYGGASLRPSDLALR
ncbi:MAG TPA: GGDEF domain-containing protein [Byssovorax sp.]|jgi:diguanylate cyclase (GGDEF)-like protein